jgi:thiol-disulfide isomerase/thioredoxin
LLLAIKFILRENDRAKGGSMKKLVKFSKPNCPHCDIFAPIFKDEIENFKNDVEFFEVDLSKAPHLIDVFNVKGVPALYSFESDDFKEFASIEQLVIGHSHEGYKDLKGSLQEVVK